MSMISIGGLFPYEFGDEELHKGDSRDHSRNQVKAAHQFGIKQGMNMQQHVWLQIFCAMLADGKTAPIVASNFADEALPLVFRRMERLA